MNLKQTHQAARDKMKRERRIADMSSAAIAAHLIGRHKVFLLILLNCMQATLLILTNF